jgi:hypothetical protein
MNEDWFPRLVDAIRADGRSMRDISAAAGLGANFIQQMLKVFAILDALGTARTFYVLTGIEMTPSDEPIIREMLTLSPDQRQKMMDLIASMRASAV